MDLSAGWLFSNLAVSTLGLAIFVYGKKQTRLPQLVAGLVMMIYPSFVASPIWMLVIGAVLVGGLWASVRAGM